MMILKGMHNVPAAWIGIENGLRGPNLTYSTACSSSGVAIGEPWLRLASGASGLWRNGHRHRRWRRGATFAGLPAPWTSYSADQSCSALQRSPVKVAVPLNSAAGPCFREASLATPLNVARRPCMARRAARPAAMPCAGPVGRCASPQDAMARMAVVASTWRRSSRLGHRRVGAWAG